jgi:hypothetical protein
VVQQNAEFYRWPAKRNQPLAAGGSRDVNVIEKEQESWALEMPFDEQRDFDDLRNFSALERRR